VKKILVTTLQVAIVLDEEHENQEEEAACDLISETFRQLQFDKTILDWEYPQGEDSLPKIVGEYDPATYEEGQAFRLNPETQL